MFSMDKNTEIYCIVNDFGEKMQKSKKDMIKECFSHKIIGAYSSFARNILMFVNDYLILILKKQLWSWC